MGWMSKLKARFDELTDSPPKENQCPRCNKNLRETQPDEVASVIVDACPKCFGMWFEKGELDRLDKSVWSNVEDHPFHETDGDHPPASCPKCLTTLTPVSPKDFSDVILDRCPSCEGFWLDFGELDRVQELANSIDQQSDENVGDEKPAGWSELRWMIVKVRQGRD